MSKHSAARNLIVGSIFWAMSIQYYIAQFVVGLKWQGANAFSLSKNTISDLGNTACTVYNGRFVCSPLHDAMNVSFIVLGLTMILGSIFLYATVMSRLTKVALLLFILSGVGTVIVGLFPENAPGSMHVIGAGLPFVGGNIALILFSLERSWPRVHRVMALIFGIVGLSALPLFLTSNSGPLGDGGMERLVAYPQSLWMIGFGAYQLLYKMLKRFSGRTI